jgi:FMN phosphatase YigB (HAD superfamily)
LSLGPGVWGPEYGGRGPRDEKIVPVAKAVIFDFSGTLFRCEDTRSWLAAVLRQANIEASEAEIALGAALVEATGGQPGSHSGGRVPPDFAELWALRDLSAERHRTVYKALIEAAGLPWPGLADALYERNAQPEAWRPYLDTAAALQALADQEIPAVVLSNIGWDPRPIFRYHKVDPLVRGYVLSYLEGVMKPDPRIFQKACDLLGHSPADVLMVGDDAVADAGATAIGCAFHQVDHLPPDERPRALLDAITDISDM